MNDERLCFSFRDMARWTWDRLNSANKYNLSFNEETITESILLMLAESHASQNLHIKAYTKAEEGRGTSVTANLPMGADWSFWMVDSLGNGIELRIQAKRQFATGQYSSLDGNGQQINDLVKNRGSAIPLYVFYNGAFPTSATSVWPLFTCSNGCLKRFRGASAWGCAVAPITGIPKSRSPYPEDIRGLRPWHCLVCTCKGVTYSSDTLPYRVASVARDMYRGVPGGAPDLLGSSVFDATPHKDAPEWVAWLDEPNMADADHWSDFWKRTNLYGVVLIKQFDLDPLWQ